MNGSPTGTDSSGGGRDRTSEVFSMFANERCRRVLSYVQSSESDIMSVQELVESMRRRDEFPDGEVRITISLVHNILPRLDSAGFIDYDVTDGTISYQDPPFVLRLLQIATEIEHVR